MYMQATQRQLKALHNEIKVDSKLSPVRTRQTVLTKTQVTCYIFPSHEYIFLIDFILYLCRSGWTVLVWR
jgi:hypothetical protein